MKIICVTGVPGTGKTAIAKKLAEKYGFSYLDVNKIIKKHKLAEGYDKKRKTQIVDIKKLNMALMKEIKTLKKENIKKNINKKIKGIIIDSHLSHYLPKKYVDLVIVAKCSIKELNKRLKRRKYQKNKIQENLQAEIFDVCYNESISGKHEVIVADTTRGFNMENIVRKLK